MPRKKPTTKPVAKPTTRHTETPAEPHDTEPVPDVLSLDLESLRTIDHPVLSALVTDLRERVAAPGTQALWGFGNVIAPSTTRCSPPV